MIGAGNRLLDDGTWEYGYNDAGQVTSKSDGTTTWGYEYDFNGRMTSATDGTDVVEYVYDVFGNRIERSHDNGTSTTIERFAYDGWDTAKPGAVGSENFDTWADLNGSNDITMRRLYGSGFDDVIGRQDELGNVAWYGTNRIGSVRLVFDNSGTVTGTRDYTGFGAITSEVGAGLDRIAYTSREWDAVIGLQYSRARMYQVDTGTWTTEDPIGFAAGDSNLFRYVGNAVTMYTDPSGLQPPPNEDTQKEFEELKKWIEEGRTWLLQIRRRLNLSQIVRIGGNPNLP